MGCDGGTIPKRDELVRTKKKAEQKDKQAELNFRWRCCSITQAPLKEPIVACGLGRLYSKDAVIMGILDKSTLPESAKHIKSLKDIKELNLTRNPAFTAEEGKSDGYVDHQTAPFICPLIGLEMNGKFKFCFSWSCGCVVSERALKELKSKLCHKCQKPVEEEDIVILNASDHDLDLMLTRSEARQAKAKAEKKAKKMATKSVSSSSTTQDDASNLPSTSSTSSNESVAIKSEKSSIPAPKEGSQKNGIKRPAVNIGLHCKDLKKTKPDYKIASDPEASKVYKSLFTSSAKAKNQMKAHWITYNPFYN